MHIFSKFTFGLLPYLFGFVFLSFGAHAAARESCTVASEFEPSLCPLYLPGITKIVITDNAATAPSFNGVNDPPCSDFRLNSASVIHYLKHAKQTKEYHDLDWSPCYAFGKVYFADNTWAYWSIQSLKSGSIRLENAKKETWLYCPTCNNPPF